MLTFYITLFITFFFSLLARNIKDKSNKPNITFTLCIMGVLVLVSGLRNNIGDTADYIYLYKLVGNGELIDGAYETGFVLFLDLLNQISRNPQLMIFTTALITNSLIIITLRRYVSLFELQTYMYITSGFYLVTMNGIRQALVASILFAATKFIIEGKFKIYCLIILLLYTLHTSALIMIPVYFLVRQETWSKKTLLLFLVLIVVFIFFQPLMSIIFDTLEGSRYASYERAIMTGGEGGANIIRVIIAAVPVIIAYLGRQRLKQIWPESHIFVNMSLLNLIIMVFSLNNWLFARFAFYFVPYTFVLLPYLIKNLFREKQLIYSLFIICYFLFFYYEQVVTLQVYYMSDFF